jgi:hypothetical protein
MAGATALSLATLAGVVAFGAAPVSDQDMRAATDRLLVEVSAVRRLAPRGTLERRVETRVAARARRGAEVAAAASEPEARLRARLAEGLGLLPVGADPAQMVGALLEGAPVASYDPLGRRLAVPDWIPLAEQRTALAHALAHALTDGRFGLRDLLEIDLEGRHHLEGDAERARLALIEGDASLTALELDDASGALTGGHALPALAGEIRGAPGAPPSWPRVVASFAHADGLAFVARVRARQPWSAVDALWADPPRSSEQILHPAKYDAREAPVVLPPHELRGLGDAWRAAATDVLGELGVRTWLTLAVPAVIAERAAAGWGGDRATLFVTTALGATSASGPDAGASPAPFVVWSTAWDDVTDAEDFARAAALVLASLAGDATTPGDDPHRFVAHGAAGVFALAWRGASVHLLVGAPEAALGALDDLLGKEPGKRKVLPRPPRRRAP